MSRDEELLGYWEQALNAKLGIYLATEDPKLLRQQLYRVRDLDGTGRYKDLVVLFPEGKGELWIAHRDADEQASAGATG